MFHTIKTNRALFLPPANLTDYEADDVRQSVFFPALLNFWSFIHSSPSSLGALRCKQPGRGSAGMLTSLINGWGDVLKGQHANKPITDVLELCYHWVIANRCM